jgi:hypothetical protein
MRRLIVIFGIALMVFAFVILTIFIIAPSVVSSLDDAPLIKGIMQTAVCRSNEELTAGYSTFRTPGTTRTSIGYNCVDKQQNARNVNDQVLQIGGIGYLVPFLVGLFMALLGRPDDKKQTNGPSAAAGSDLADRTAHADRIEAILEARQKSSGSTISNPGGHVHSQAKDQPNHLPLAQRLEELKQAFNEGLITEAEYTAKRKDLLNQS